LAIHLDHWDRAELDKQSWADCDHFRLVASANGVELVQCPVNGGACSVQVVLELAQHVVSGDRLTLSLKQ